MANTPPPAVPPGEALVGLIGVAAAASARRHGLPRAVRPLHVVETFLESERGRRDSGVRPEKLIFFLDRSVYVYQVVGMDRGGSKRGRGYTGARKRVDVRIGRLGL